MSEKRKAPLGADLVIPALALGFAAYFFHSIVDLAWEAKANGVMIGGILVLLIAIQLVRIAVRVARGEGGLGAEPLWAPREVLARRLGLVAVTVLFIASLKWLGLTLGLLLALFAALWLMGVRKPAALAGAPLVISATVYGLFIAILKSDLPHGPVERLLAALFG